MINVVASGLLAFVFAAAVAATSDPSESTLYADQGDNVTLKCLGYSGGAGGVFWNYHRRIRVEADDGSEDDDGRRPLPSPSSPSASAPAAQRIAPQSNGDLAIYGVRPEDAKTYSCQDMESNESIHTVSLTVRTVPPAVANLSVLAHSVFALVTWAGISSSSEGGLHPVTGYVLGYRRDKSRLTDLDEELESEKENSTYEWSYVRDIGPASTSRAVYGLVPNSTYYFRLCAVNRLGPGKNVTVMAETTYDPAEVEGARDLEEADESPSPLKLWGVAIAVFLVTFAIIGFGISLLLLRNCDFHRRRNSSCETTEEEAMELVPHITLNPSFNIDMLEYIEASDDGGGASQAVLNQIQAVTSAAAAESDEVNLVNSPARRGRIGAAAASSAGNSSKESSSPARPNG